MHGDQLLQQWKQAKQSCKKIIDNSIKANILKTPTQQLTKQQFINIYDIVYKLCCNPIGQQTRVGMVYKDFKDIMINGLILMSKKLNEERQVCKLQMLRKIFDAYQDSLKRIKHLFAFLERQYIIKQAKIDQLDRTGITIIVTTLFTEQRLLEYDSIYFKQISKIRKNKDLGDARILKDYVQILYKFHIRLSKKQIKNIRTLYTDFRQKYLTNSKQYYTYKFHKFQQLSPSEYFLEVNNQYQFEKIIIQECFGTSSQSFINKAFSIQFLQEYRNKLIQSSKGLKYILQNREIQAITVITTLYKKLTNSVDGFKEPFENFIYEQIASLLVQMRAELIIKKSTSIYIAFVQKLFKKNTELIEILEYSFMKFNQFVGYYKSGIQRAFSKNHLQIPIQQMLACYVDQKFRIAYNGQDAMKQDVRNVKNIFECLQNKDLFLIKYLQKLAKKIMSITPEGIQNHQNLIYHLKIHSGNKIAQKLQTVLDQYKLSLQHEKQFREVQSAFKLPYSLNLFVFSQAVWPFNQLVQFKPDQLANIFGKGLECIKIYEKQKVQRKTLRISFLDSRIRWIYHFQKQVQNKFAEAYFDTNGLQAVLLQYIYQHRPQKISLSILSNVFSHLKPIQIRQSLQKMHEPQESPILLSFQIDSEIYYQFNQLMKSKKRMLQYDTVIQEQQQEQALFQKKQLSKQRQYAIDANVAKLMKTKKVLGFDKIIQEVIKMIKVFTPGTRDIKASIERLLAKDVLVREDRDRNSIRYKD